jgi:O-acetylhomoserine (thiol)-lyase
LQRQIASAQAIAEHLASHPQIDWINYPGLPTSPNYELANKYLLKGPAPSSRLVSRELAQAKKFIEALKIFSFLANV